MVYLDNAATTFPKPRAVYDALALSMRECAGNPGRGGHILSRNSAKALFDSRVGVASLLGSSSPERVAFTHNATEALNIAIKGLARKNSHILISDIEHNSVRRVAVKLQEQGIEYSVYSSAKSAEDILNSVRENIRPDTQMLVACHKSNICSRELPLAELGRLCKKYGIYFVVEASQSAGSCNIDIGKVNADAICAPGHKGLFGIMGSGFVLFGEGVEGDKIKTMCEGGNGVNSMDEQMPSALPERLEAGTLPMPAIYTLKAGIEFVRRVGAEEIGNKESVLMARAKDMLLHTKGIEVYCPEENGGGVLLFNFKNIDCEEAAELLDKGKICVRAGLHCSPLAHKTIGTPSGGAIRVSFGYFNTLKDIDCLYKTVKDILAGVY